MVQIGLPDSGTLGLQMLYIQQLECVTVRAVDPGQQAILSALFPGDDGSELPSETAVQLAVTNGIDFTVNRPDRPYM